jgi:protein arginine kinase
MRINPASVWLHGGDGAPDHDVVVSSRARIARNVAGFPFVGRSTPAQRTELLRLVQRTPFPAEWSDGLLWVDLLRSTEEDRQLLAERRLISRQFAQADLPRAVAFSRDETVSIMVNEEDHLRLQSLLPGLRLDECLRRVRHLDESLERHLDFAFSPRWGYLTACPTNLGTAVRLSVMVHLPALKITREIEKVKNAAKDLHLAVRGFLGEGSETIGDLYQISNQLTLGMTEEDLLERFATGIVPSLLEYERVARRAIVANDPVGLEDKVHRALAVLRAARLLEVDESMRMLGRLRLGVALGRVRGVSLAAIDRLMLDLQPVHLRTVALPDDRDPRLRASRAAAVRRTLAGVEIA